MIREPVMLTDTAMLLLQLVEQTKEDARAMLVDPFQDDELLRASIEWENYSPFLGRGARLSFLLLQDIWHVWTYRDLAVIRHLEWHLVLDDDLMTLAARAFFSAHTYDAKYQTRHPAHDEKFRGALFKAYRQALAERKTSLSQEE